MDYNATLVRKAASLARRRGFRVVVNDSKTTESSYCLIGLPSRKCRDGIEIIAELRVSNHRLPGRGRGGWLRGGYLKFDLRPRSRRNDFERVEKFVRRCCVLVSINEQ